MKNINLQVDEETLANAEQFALKLNTSVAGLLNDFLHQLPVQQGNLHEARQRLLQLSQSATGKVGVRTWTRESLYER
jgi:hypothetical protein